MQSGCGKLLRAGGVVAMAIVTLFVAYSGISGNSESLVQDRDSNGNNGLNRALNGTSEKDSTSNSNTEINHNANSSKEINQASHANKEKKCPYKGKKMSYHFSNESRIINTDINVRKEECPNLMLSTDPRGRLGNQLSTYATLLGVAQYLPDYKPFIQQETHIQLTSLFNGHLTMKECLETKTRRHITSLNLRGPTDTFPKFLANITNNSAGSENHLIFLDYGPFFPHLYHPLRDQILQEFVFEDSLQVEVARFMQWVHIQPMASNSSVLVSMHVRRTDYCRVVGSYVGVNFFTKAINELENSLAKSGKNIDKLVFIVTSDDFTWCKNALKQINKAFIYSNDFHPHLTQGIHEREFDLALAAACHHAIYDFGTFGFWGAYLQRTPGGSHVVTTGRTGRKSYDFLILSLKEAKIEHWTFIDLFTNDSSTASSFGASKR